MVGTALEWYDFFVYGTAAALVFGQVFFPVGEPALGVLASFASFAVAFVFRPLGGLLFGLLGDRVGRRSVLVATTVLMGFATGVVGLLPSYQQIGILAPVLLVVARVCQGLAAGAEFSGACTLVAEHAPAAGRGFYASFVQAGVQVGLLGGTVAFLVVGSLGDGALLAWGWRLPFLTSFLTVFVSLYVRLRVAESPVFSAEPQARPGTRSTVEALAILRRGPRNLLVGVGAHVCDTAVVYVYTAFLITYVTRQVGASRTVALTGSILFTVAAIVLQPVYGALSDRWGRRPLNLFGVAFTALFAFPLFALVDTGVPVLMWLGLLAAAAFGFAPMVAVQPAFYAELFDPAVRLTGFALSRELGAMVSGFSPLIAAGLLNWGTGEGWPVAAWVVLTALVSGVAFLFSRETRGIALTAGAPIEPDLAGLSAGRGQFALGHQVSPTNSWGPTVPGATAR
jgi:MFS family permease